MWPSCTRWWCSRRAELRLDEFQIREIETALWVAAASDIASDEDLATLARKWQVNAGPLWRLQFFAQNSSERCDRQRLVIGF